MTLLRGVYPPVPTFFDENEDLDLAIFRTHVMWLAEHALAGILVLGSNGEAIHLSNEERITMIRTAREIIDAAKSKGVATDWQLLAGTADFTTRGTIVRCQNAAAAGADVAVVLPPSGFPSQMTANALITHFLAVADASPIPVTMYNMPANTGGIDLSPDVILTVAQHPNVIGVKDSSANVAKIGQLAAAAPENFSVLAGSGHILLPSLSVGGMGAIAAVANVIPDLTVTVMSLWQQHLEQGAFELYQQARDVQAAIAPLNQSVTTVFGVAGLKSALQSVRGYGGLPRRPLLPVSNESAIIIRNHYDSARKVL